MRFVKSRALPSCYGLRHPKVDVSGVKKQVLAPPVRLAWKRPSRSRSVEAFSVFRTPSSGRRTIDGVGHVLVTWTQRPRSTGDIRATVKAGRALGLRSPTLHTSGDLAVSGAVPHRPLERRGRSRKGDHQGGPGKEASSLVASAEHSKILCRERASGCDRAHGRTFSTTCVLLHRLQHFPSLRRNERLLPAVAFQRRDTDTATRMPATTDLASLSRFGRATTPTTPWCESVHCLVPVPKRAMGDRICAIGDFTRIFHPPVARFGAPAGLWE